MSIQVTTLENGFRIVTDHMPSVETVSLGVWVKAGTRNEHIEINGVAHFLEHMAFKGTRKRTALQIAESIEDVGGYINAYTSREITAYYARVMKQDIGLVVDLLADILQNSTFLEEEFEKEREVILQEIGQCHDTPDDVVYDYFQERAFADQPMGWPILGPADTIKNMTRQSLIDFMAAHYTPKNMVFAAAGNVDHDVLVKLVRDHFDLKVRKEDQSMLPGHYVGGDFRQHRSLEQLHLLLGFKGISFVDDSYHTAALYATIMGGGMSSRLFQEIREKRGLVYSIYAFSSAYSDCGVFGVYAGTSEKDSGNLVSVVRDELLKAPDTLLAQEIIRAKNQTRAGIAMALESTTARSKRLAKNLLDHDRIISVDESLEKINKVEQGHLAEFAAQLTSTSLTVAAIGPTKKLPEYAVLQKDFSGRF